MADTQAIQNCPSINGQGRVPNWRTQQAVQDDDEECDSVGIKEEEAEELFQQQLINIDEEMGVEDLHALKFLCVDYIPVSKLEAATSPLDIFMHMKKALLIDNMGVDFLLECLGRMHRFDLVRKFGFEPDDVKAELPNMQNITLYRRFLMELAEDMDDKDLQKLKFYLSGQIKKKKLSDASTILELFVLMEQEEMMSARKPDSIAGVMRAIGRPDLVTVVNKFTGNDQVRHVPQFTRTSAPANPNEPQPALPAQGNRLGSQPQGIPLPANIPQQREVMVGSGIEAGASGPPGGRPPVNWSASAGTLSVSDSESGSIDEAMGQEDILPAELFHQIADGLKFQFNDTGIELGFTNDAIEQYNEQYQDPLVKTKKLLKDWQAGKIDKSQIAPGLHYALIKLGQKMSAEALKRWMEERYSGNQTRQQGHGQVLSGAPNRAPIDNFNRRPVGPGQDINYTASMNEARPRDFGFQDHQRLGQPALPVTVGPPVNNYQAQGSENNCVSLKEARSQNSEMEPQMQDTDMRQTEEFLRNMRVSGLTEQQIVANLRQTGVPDPQVPVPDAAPTNPAPVTGGAHDALPEYKMNRNPRGWCVIINNREFFVDRSDQQAKEMPPRVGTDKDAESLQVIFQNLGFSIHRRNNLTDTEIMQFLIEVAYNVDHSQFDCLVVCILTHGVENHVYGSNGKLVSIKDITSTFQANRCPKLAGKPKLFFLQACQGRNKMEGNDIERDAAPMAPTNQRESSIETDDEGKEMIPNEADFLIGYATVPGYVSFRSRNHGSWYIRKLCELLEKYASRHDLLSILVEVNREVSHANAHLDGGVFKQTPAPLVTLRKKLYFR